MWKLENLIALSIAAITALAVLIYIISCCFPSRASFQNWISTWDKFTLGHLITHIIPHPLDLVFPKTNGNTNQGAELDVVHVAPAGQVFPMQLVARDSVE